VGENGGITRGKLHEQKIHQERSAMFAAGVLILHDKTRPHASGTVSEILEKYGWQVLPPPYSPDMSPPDFDLFPKLKKPLCGKLFGSIEQMSNEVTRVIRRIINEGVLTGIHDLPKRWDHCDKSQWSLH
jgi:transposase